MAHGFLYLVAILDVASRKVLAFRLSNTMTAEFCVVALEEALTKFGRPAIFNTDQGSHQPPGSYERGGGYDPQVIVDLILKGVGANRPKTRYAAGRYAKAMMLMRKWFFDKVVPATIK